MERILKIIAHYRVSRMKYIIPIFCALALCSCASPREVKDPSVSEYRISGLEENLLPHPETQTHAQRLASHNGDLDKFALEGFLLVEEDVSKGMDILKYAHEVGSPWAGVYLGSLYNSGVHVLSNRATAIRYFREAGFRGNSGGMLGVCLLYTSPSPRD